MHKKSEERESLCLMASTSGGIEQGFEKIVCLKRKAVTGATKVLYWLCKNEIAHFIEFESL